MQKAVPMMPTFLKTINLLGIDTFQLLAEDDCLEKKKEEANGKRLQEARKRDIIGKHTGEVLLEVVKTHSPKSYIEY